MWNWPAIKDSATNTPRRIVSLSGTSQTLIGAAYFDLKTMTKWRGDDYELTPEEIDDIKSAVDRLIYEIGVSSMIGAIFPYARGAIHPDWLPCDGSTYERSDYPDLYDALPKEYQLSDTQFTTPNLSDRMVVGTGIEFAEFATGGEKEVTLSLNQMPLHDHTESIVITTLGVVGEIPAFVPTGSAGITGSAGNDEPHNNMPPYIALPYAIVAR